MDKTEREIALACLVEEAKKRLELSEKLLNLEQYNKAGEAFQEYCKIMEVLLITKARTDSHPTNSTTQ